MAVTWKAFPLHPETPEEGQSLEQLFAGQDMNIPKMVAGLKETAAGLGLPFGDRLKTFNSRRAQELGKWAETLGRGDAFHHAAFAAYFVHGRNIADPAVLADIATKAGLPGRKVAGIIATGRFSDAVDADWQRSADLGIRVIPTFRANGRMLQGAKSYEALLKFVRTEKTENRRIF